MVLDISINLITNTYNSLITRLSYRAVKTKNITDPFGKMLARAIKS